MNQSIGKYKMKIIPKLNKNKFDIDTHVVIEDDDLIVGDDPDCQLNFSIKNDIVTISSDWIDGFPLESLVSLLVLMSTGDIIQPTLQEISGTHPTEEFETIKSMLIEKIKEYKTEEEETPAIQPIDTFNHIINMTNGNEGG